MTLSRKEFLTRGLVSFGQELARNVRGEADSSEAGPHVEAFGPLTVDNRHCLAQRGGCFACLDLCPKEAITIRLGVGIAIDAGRCDGCGRCVESCPVTPRVIAMKPKNVVND